MGHLRSLLDLARTSALIPDPFGLEPRDVEAPPLERKLVAILAADAEGYSRLMHDDEEATLQVLSSHRAIVDEIIVNARGQISGTAGDSILAEFPSVTDAVRAGVAMQQALSKANGSLPEERKMLFRIGINVGDVMVKDGDIFGDGVNVASRIESLAEPGGICVTRGVRDHLRDRDDYTFDDLGEHSVKNIERPVRVFKVLFDPGGTTELDEVTADTAPAAKTQPDAVSADTVELTFWESVRDSDNPAMFRAYLEKFPNGEFKALAEIRVGELAVSAANT